MSSHGVWGAYRSGCRERGNAKVNQRRRPWAARGGDRGGVPGEEERAGERLGEVGGCLVMLTKGGIELGLAGEEVVVVEADSAGAEEEAGCAASRWRNLQIGRGVRLFVV